MTPFRGDVNVVGDLRRPCSPGRASSRTSGREPVEPQEVVFLLIEDRHLVEASLRRVQALLALRKPEHALTELRTAMTIADEVGSPPGRWRSRAALGKALY